MMKTPLLLAFLFIIQQAAFGQSRSETPNHSPTSSSTTVKHEKKAGPANGSGTTVMLPIPATGYTDPHYETNKKKSEEVQRALDATPTPAPGKAERIQYLEEAIKGIESGRIRDDHGKLPYYKQELAELKNQ